MKPQGHYHVDVFRADGRYLRGFTLQRVGETSTYRVVDDCGLFFPRGTPLSEPLPVAEALRQALAETRKHVAGPITPFFGSAPFDLLGYEPPRFFKADQEVGPDGRPGRTFRRRRGIPKGLALVDIEEDGVGIYSRPRGTVRASFALSRRARRSLAGRAPEKPLEVVRRRSPTWLRDLTFSFDVFFSLLEVAPGGSSVTSVQFRNPPSGFVFVDADLAPRGDDLPLACAEAAIGNKVDDGKIVVNGRELRFRCDCSSGVDLWIALPEGGAWLTRAALREIGERAARRHGVTVAW